MNIIFMYYCVSYRYKIDQDKINMIVILYRTINTNINDILIYDYNSFI